MVLVCVTSPPSAATLLLARLAQETKIWRCKIHLGKFLGIFGSLSKYTRGASAPCAFPIPLPLAGCQRQRLLLVAFTKVSSSHIVGRCQKCYFPPFLVPFGSTRAKKDTYSQWPRGGYNLFFILPNLWLYGTVQIFRANLLIEHPEACEQAVYLEILWRLYS